MKFALKKSVSRSGLSAALSLAMLSVVPSLAQADALSQSFLNITNFNIGFNPANANFTSSPPSVGINSSATFAGVAGTPVTTATSSRTVAGPNRAQFNQTTKITGLPIPQFNYAGGFASQTGSSLPGGGGAAALTDAVVSLVPGRAAPNSSSGANQIAQQFTVTVASGTGFTVGFNADMFMRSFLSAGPGAFIGGSALTKAVYSLTVSQQTGGSFSQIALWDPSNTAANGGFTCEAGTGITGCLATAAFRLNRTVDAFNNNENNLFSQAGLFNSSFSLAQGTYRFQIVHDSQASAALLIPEPGTLALVGLSLVGLAAVGRRRAMRQTA